MHSFGLHQFRNCNRLRMLNLRHEVCSTEANHRSFQPKRDLGAASSRIPSHHRSAGSNLPLHHSGLAKVIPTRDGQDVMDGCPVNCDLVHPGTCHFPLLAEPEALTKALTQPVQGSSLAIGDCRKQNTRPALDIFSEIETSRCPIFGAMKPKTNHCRQHRLFC